jgi:hypothetical protein
VYNAINKVVANLRMVRNEKSMGVCKNVKVITVNVVAVWRLFAVMDVRGNKVVSGTFIVILYSFAGSAKHI